MSSYNQVAETRSLAETLSLAVVEIIALDDELSDLCASISAQFPGRYEDIPKYQEALHASEALGYARTLLYEPVDRLPPSTRNRPVTVTIGKQTRQNRPTSQRVRLGNAVVRLKGVLAALAPNGFGFEEDLAAVIEELEGVTFPARFG